LTILIMFFRCHSVSFSAYSTLSLHDALPISLFPGTDRQGTGIFRKYVGDLSQGSISPVIGNHHVAQDTGMGTARPNLTEGGMKRSEEHTSELQSREKLVCRLLLEQKKKETFW